MVILVQSKSKNRSFKRNSKRNLVSETSSRERKEETLKKKQKAKKIVKVVDYCLSRYIIVPVSDNKCRKLWN